MPVLPACSSGESELNLSGMSIPDVRHIPAFGGPGNDTLSFAAPDLVDPDARAAAPASLRQRLEELAATPEGPAIDKLQLGCVPEEHEEEVRNIVAELLPGLVFVSQIGRANAFAARGSDGGAVAAPEVPAIGGGLRVERASELGAEGAAWLQDFLQEHNYPPFYIDLLRTSKDIVQPHVVLDSEGVPVAHVLQEFSDLSIGALFVKEACRGQGIGSWLLDVMARAIAEEQGRRAVSLVESGNEAGEKTHVRTGFAMEGKPLLWLGFMRP